MGGRRADRTQVTQVTQVLPNEQEQQQNWRNEVAWQLARQLATDPQTRGLDSFSLWNAIRHHYNRLQPPESFDDFAEQVDYCYHTVRVRHGEHPLEDAIAGDFPSPIDDPRPHVRRLASVCRFLSDKHGGKPFPLSVSVACRILGWKPTPPNRAKAYRTLQTLVRLKVLTVHKRGVVGPGSTRATTFKFTLPKPDEDDLDGYGPLRFTA